MEKLCVGGLCHWMVLHYFSTLFGAVVCLGLFLPAQILCCRHTYYFGVNKTTWERRGPHYVDMCYYDENVEMKSNVLNCDLKQIQAQ